MTRFWVDLIIQIILKILEHSCTITSSTTCIPTETFTRRWRFWWRHTSRQWSYYTMAKFKSAETPKCNTSSQWWKSELCDTSATSKASKAKWWNFELLAESLFWHTKYMYDHCFKGLCAPPQRPTEFCNTEFLSFTVDSLVAPLVLVFTLFLPTFIYITYLSVNFYGWQKFVSGFLDDPIYFIFPFFTNISFYSVNYKSEKALE